MDNRQIAHTLEEMAVVLELTGANTFKVRAYAKAARILYDMRENVGDIIDSGELTSIEGIGENLAKHIEELFRTGKIETYDKLRASVPDGVFEMLRISGLGPKKTGYLWKERNIMTIGELEFLCRSHMVARFPGFGEKTEENMLAGIKSLKKFAGKNLMAEALFLANEIRGEIKSWPEVIRSEIAGSIRRRMEIVRDIDILVATTRPEKVMNRFVSLSNVERVLQHGATKSEVILSSGIQCDLRTVTDAQYPFALYYFTGSKEHNVRMRARAKGRKMKLNEYGLFKGASKKSLPCRDEAEIFGALGLEYIEPELREDMGEIDAASCSNLPALIDLSDIRGLIHVHSTYTDGAASISELVERARLRGHKYMAICDHSQAVTVAGGMKPADVKRQHEEISRLNRKMKDFRILKGIEVDILPDGSLDFDDDLLATFEVVIASIHSRFGMSEDKMTERIIRGMSNPHVDILAHPTGRLLLAREPYAVDLKRVIDVLGDLGKAVEINAHPQRLDLDWRWCKYAKERDVRFTIGPDAHLLEGLDHVIFGVWTARKGWLEKDDVLNCLSADKLIKHFKKI